MEIKFTVKNMTQEFYNGFGASIIGFNTIAAMDKFLKLQELSKVLDKSIKQKEEQFNKRVELNTLIKSGSFTVTHDVSKRRGYDVHTFTFLKG